MTTRVTERRDVALLPRSPIPSSVLDDAETLTGAFTTLVERFPDWECVTILDRDGIENRCSLGQIGERARSIQRSLEAAGLRAGGVVLIALPTGVELVSAYFGVMLAGGIPGLVATPSNRVADRRVYTTRVGAILADAAAHVLYCDDAIAEHFEEAGGDVLGRTALLTPERARASSDATSIAPAEPDGVATVQYSSGSTGTPKGILLTHRAMLNNIRAVRDGLGLTAHDVSVNWIPLYHDMGLIDAFLLPLFTGCPTVLIPTNDFMRDPSLWLWAIHRYRGTLSWAPNFAYTFCAKRIPDETIEGLDLSSWRIAINAAEPVLPHTIEAFTARFAAYGFEPAAMTPAWGLAENVTIATAHPVEERPAVETIDRRRLATEGIAHPVTGDGVPSVAIGRCLPDCAVEIRDDAGQVLADRSVGRIFLRTNSLFECYHRQPELTARTLLDGWLDTGDRGYMANGNLYFVSRDKDLVVIGGEKYAPHDVETAINRVPGVREGCAIAFGFLNDQRGTEELAAVVETRETAADALAALRQAIRAEVTNATGLLLRHVVLVEPGGIEKTTSGKLARRATQHRYADRLK